MSVEHIQYKNSGDGSYGDKSRVVGYHSFIFTRREQQTQHAGFSLSTEEKGRC